jgi:hypothetical protein
VSRIVKAFFFKYAIHVQHFQSLIKMSHNPFLILEKSWLATKYRAGTGARGASKILSRTGTA